MNFADEINNASILLSESKYAVVFTGAGISVESGIPSFRGPEGLWSKYAPEVLSLSKFYSHPEEAWKDIKEIFYDFFGAAQPGKAHTAIADMEKLNLIKAVITQNIDNLHQLAGSTNVIEYHGTCSRMRCIKCAKTIDSKYVNLSKLPPHCSCGGILKPDFVFFEEGIPEKAANEAYYNCMNADVMIIVGTTGEVMPAASLPVYAKSRGCKIIEINPGVSSFTKRITDIYIPEKAGLVLPEIFSAICEIRHNNAK